MSKPIKEVDWVELPEFIEVNNTRWQVSELLGQTYQNLTNYRRSGKGFRMLTGGRGGGYTPDQMADIILEPVPVLIKRFGKTEQQVNAMRQNARRRASADVRVQAVLAQRLGPNWRVIINLKH